jgi:hypothetical protein
LNDLPPLQDRQQRRLLRGGGGEMNGRNDTILSTWDFNQTQPSTPISPSSTTTFNHHQQHRRQVSSSNTVNDPFAGFSTNNSPYNTLPRSMSNNNTNNHHRRNISFDFDNLNSSTSFNDTPASPISAFGGGGGGGHSRLRDLSVGSSTRSTNASVKFNLIDQNERDGEEEEEVGSSREGRERKSESSDKKEKE